jgi:thiosulfate reductase cytochrome b subunit
MFVTNTVDENSHPYRAMWDISARLAEGMYWHFFFAWIFAINGTLYVIYLAFSGEWRSILPRAAALGESIQVVLVDLHLSKAKLPVRKYNAAQQIAYTGVIVMGLLMLLTGLSIYKPAQQAWLTHLFGGYTVARFIHFWTTMGFLGFFVVHVGQVVRTGWNNFRGMISGQEIVTVEEKQALEAQAGVLSA